MVSTELSAEACATELMETMPAVLHFIRRRLRSLSPSGFSIPQVRALSYLSRYPYSSLNELADYLGVSNASASAMIERLVQKELVARKEDPNERRCVELSLTTRGEFQYKEVHNLATAELALVLGQIPPRKLRLIYEGLSHLRDAFATGE